MRRALGLFCALFLAGAGRGIAAEFPYSTELTVFYVDGPPADGKFLKDKFFVAGTTKGVSAKDLHLYADISTGPGTPVLLTMLCKPGEIEPGWTVAYGRGSCNLWDDIVVPAGKTLHASYSNSFAPSTFHAVTEAVKPYPGKAPSTCAPPPSATANGSTETSVTVNVYQLPGVIGIDGTLDKAKICIVATPHGRDAVGLHIQGSLIARQGGKDTYIGSQTCALVHAPQVVPAGTSVVCTPANYASLPERMVVPKNAKLFVATTVTFGQDRSAPAKPVPIKFYGKQ